MFDYADDYILIRFYPVTKGLYAEWLPGNQSMSQLDFKRTIEIFLNTITVVQPVVILIDASEYAYPIVSKETIRLIRYALSGSSVKFYGLIKSKHLFGEIAITHLLCKISDIQPTVRLLTTRKKGLKWFLSKKHKTE